MDATRKAVVGYGAQKALFLPSFPVWGRVEGRKEGGLKSLDILVFSNLICNFSHERSIISDESHVTGDVNFNLCQNILPNSKRVKQHVHQVLASSKFL